jgi:predicted dehydrogenase
MDSQKLGIAIFGVGRWGVHLVRNFLQHPQAQVMAIADPSPDRLKDLSKRFTLGQSVVLTTDWKTAMTLPGVEAVAIATPATTHYHLIHNALEHQHHVLAEKPLTLDWQEAVDLCQLAETQQRQLVIDHTYLFHPAVRSGQQAIQQGLPGELRYGYASRTHLGPVRQDVDALWDLAIHDIAIFNYWLNATPVQVQAQGTVWLQARSPSQALFPNGLSDVVWVKLIYPTGFQAHIHLCWLNPDKQRRLAVVGSKGTLIFDELASAAPLIFQQGHLENLNQHYIPVDQHYQPLTTEAAEPLQQVCQHFLHCALNNSPSNLSSGWVGAQLVKILSALTQSINQNGTTVELSLPITYP